MCNFRTGIVEHFVEDMGIKLGLELETGTSSTAARGIAGRKGLGKTRHMRVAFLWLQERLRMGT